MRHAFLARRPARCAIAAVALVLALPPVRLGEATASSDAAQFIGSGGNLAKPADKSLAAMNPRSYARRATRSAVEFGCLVRLWTRESNWNPRSRNHTPVWQGGVPKHAFGIAQLVGEKATDARTQIDHGLAYIRDRYPLGACQALSFSDRHGYY